VDEEDGAARVGGGLAPEGVLEAVVGGDGEARRGGGRGRGGRGGGRGAWVGGRGARGEGDQQERDPHGSRCQVPAAGARGSDGGICAAAGGDGDTGPVEAL
jgi:hypothetical protein